MMKKTVLMCLVGAMYAQAQPLGQTVEPIRVKAKYSFQASTDQYCRDGKSSIRKGDEFLVIGSSSSGCFEVEYRDQRLYVSRGFLNWHKVTPAKLEAMNSTRLAREEREKKDTATAERETRIANAVARAEEEGLEVYQPSVAPEGSITIQAPIVSLSVYPEPGLSAKKDRIGIIAPYSDIHIVGAADWFHLEIDFNGRPGYISVNRYLEIPDDVKETITALRTDADKRAKEEKERKHAEALADIKKRDAELKAAKEAAARKQKAEREASIRRLCREYAPRPDCEATITAGKVWVGAPAELAFLAWGKPKRVNKTTTAFGTAETWIYGGSNFLYIVNGKVNQIHN
jgi:hypothetical protein